MVLTNSTPMVYSIMRLSGRIPIQWTVPSSGPLSLIHTTRSPISSGGLDTDGGSDVPFGDDLSIQSYISGFSSDNWRRWFWNWSRSEIWLTAAKTPHRSSQSKYCLPSTLPLQVPRPRYCYKHNTISHKLYARSLQHSIYQPQTINIYKQNN